MATDCSELFVGLAVIINDWDTDPQPNRAASDHNDATTSSHGECSQSPTAIHADEGDNSWQSSLEDVLEDFWCHMTSSLKKKVRKACVEVLKRTDEPETAQVESRKEDESHLLE